MFLKFGADFLKFGADFLIFDTGDDVARARNDRAAVQVNKGY